MVKRTMMAALLVATALVWGCATNNGTKPINEGVTDGQTDPGTTTDPGATKDKVTTKDEGTAIGDEGTATGDEGVAETDVPPIPACDQADLPQTWGGATILYAIQLVDSTDTTAMKVCADFNGDGKPDNGFGSFASMANGYLKTDGSLTNQAAVTLEFAGVTDYANTAKFQMNGLFGKLKAIVDGNKDAVASTTDINDVDLDPKSYTAKNGKCEPLLAFPDAKITDGLFDSGKSTFAFSIPIQGLVLKLRVTQANLTGTVVNTSGETAFELKDGVLTGYLLKTDLDAALATAQDYCDNAENPPSACSYLTLIPTLLTYDLDMNNDGEADAISLCITFNSVKANIAGYIPGASSSEGVNAEGTSSEGVNAEGTGSEGTSADSATAEGTSSEGAGADSASGE